MAAFVRFARPFNYSPLGARWAIGYAAGRTVLVPEPHATAAERLIGGDDGSQLLLLSFN